MKPHLHIEEPVFAIFLAGSIPSLLLAVAMVGRATAADTLYVDLQSATPIPPYTNWQTAATNVLDAVEEAQDADTVVVADGTYPTPQRIHLTNSIALVSANGAYQTTLAGYGTNWVLYVQHTGAVVNGFTITGGFGWTANYIRDGTLKRCIVRDCHSEGSNGGRGAVALGADGLLESCLVVHNTARDLNPEFNNRSTGGVTTFGGTVANCTITDNTLLAGRGGGGLQVGYGVENALVQNTIIWGNSSPDGVQAAIWTDFSTFSHCCMPHDVSYTVNRIGQAPQFRSSLFGDYRLVHSSPCVDAGTNQGWMATATDLDGSERISDGDVDGAALVDVGAYEYIWPTGSLLISGSPEPYGAPYSLGYGDHQIPAGLTVSSTVSERIEGTSGVAYRCTGWTGSGSVPSSGTGTSVTFTIQHLASTLTWQWSTEHWGVPEWWLVLHGWTSDFANAITADQDGDGFVTAAEWQADTVPTNGQSFLALTGMQVTGGAVRIEWQGGSDAMQYLDEREHLTETGGSWRTAFTNPPPTDVNAEYLHSGMTNSSATFRLRAERP